MKTIRSIILEVETLSMNEESRSVILQLLKSELEKGIVEHGL